MDDGPPNDAAVIGTGMDAALGKRSAVSLGYYRDDFIELLASRTGSGRAAVTSECGKGGGDGRSAHQKSRRRGGWCGASAGAPGGRGRGGVGRGGNPSIRRRRSPLMNRGHYARVASMDHVVNAFLEAGIVHGEGGGRGSGSGSGGGSDSGDGNGSSTRSGSTKRKQIVSLGAGIDTTFFRVVQRLLESGRNAGGQKAEDGKENEVAVDKERGGCNGEDGGGEQAWSMVEERLAGYYEVDFPDVIEQKARLVASSPDLRSLARWETQKDQSKSSSPPSSLYHVVGCDLRNAVSLRKSLLATGFRRDLPTLWIAECVLIYLEPEAGDAVIATAAELSLWSVGVEGGKRESEKKREGAEAAVIDAGEQQEPDEADQSRVRNVHACEWFCYHSIGSFPLTLLFLFPCLRPCFFAAPLGLCLSLISVPWGRLRRLFSLSRMALSGPLIRSDERCGEIYPHADVRCGA